MKGHKKGHGKGHVKRSKGGYVGSLLPKRDPQVHPLVTATKQAQNLMKIVDALPDQETKDLAMELYKGMGDKL
jgi:hypothetical protein